MGPFGFKEDGRRPGVVGMGRIVSTILGARNFRQNAPVSGAFCRNFEEGRGGGAGGRAAAGRPAVH
jgi:hypothetical protein